MSESTEEKMLKILNREYPDHDKNPDIAKELSLITNSMAYANGIIDGDILSMTDDEMDEFILEQ